MMPESAGCIALIANKPGRWLGVLCSAIVASNKAEKRRWPRVNSRVLMELYHQLERFRSPGGASAQWPTTDAVVHMH